MQIQKNTHETIVRLSAGRSVSKGLLKKSMKEILPMKEDTIRTALLSGLLNGLMTRGPTKNEITPLIESIFEYCEYQPFSTKSESHGKKIIGVMGSGKKGHKTLNISSASSVLAAGIGSLVVKPVSSSTSSVTGSSDFFEICGVNTCLEPKEAADVLSQVGLVPLKIENAVKKFDDAYGGRFFAPHALSFGLPPLLCSIRYDFLLYGLAHPNIQLSAEVLRHFGVENALIYSSTNDGVHYLDEMGVFGSTGIIGIRNGRLGRFRYVEPAVLLNLPRYTPKDIKQRKTPVENISIILSILAGKTGKCLDAIENIICINAANILYAAGNAKDLKDGFELSKKAIRSGIGFEKMRELVQASGGDDQITEKILKGGAV